MNLLKIRVHKKYNICLGYYKCMSKILSIFLFIIGLLGFRRKHIVRQILCVAKYACMFPIFSTIYMIAPNSKMGQLAKKPFLKFIFESASYMFFLFLLALASQQVEHIIIDIISMLNKFYFSLNMAN